MQAFRTIDAANDASPLFPDLSAMSHEEFINHEPPPERLAFYALHTDEARKAFLYDLYWIGYPGLFIAVNHVWNLLVAPRPYRCTLMGQHSGAGGAGKQALVNTLRQFIDQALAISLPVPQIVDFETIEAWDQAVTASYHTEEAELHQLIDRYEAILNGFSAAPKSDGER